MSRLTDKVAVITGGGQGLGAATATLFASEGSQVVVADIDLKTAEQTVEQIHSQGGTALAIKVDITVAQDAQRLISDTVRQFGRVDVLVNNAGIASLGTVVDLPEDDWDRVMAVNVKGAFLCSRFAVSQMQQQGGGSIVCVASASGVIGQQNQIAYNASKHAVIGLVRCMALDHAADNIRGNAICPGVINTPMLGTLSSDKLEQLRGMHAMARLAKPSEIAQAILHLASDEASFTTGSAYLADGGITAM